MERPWQYNFESCSFTCSSLHYCISFHSFFILVWSFKMILVTLYVYRNNIFEEIIGEGYCFAFPLQIIKMISGFIAILNLVSVMIYFLLTLCLADDSKCVHKSLSAHSTLPMIEKWFYILQNQHFLWLSTSCHWYYLYPFHRVEDWLVAVALTQMHASAKALGAVQSQV